MGTDERKTQPDAYGLWSLWAMLNFYGDKTLTCLGLISGLGQYVTMTLQAHADMEEWRMGDAAMRRAQVAELQRLCLEMHLPMSADAAGELVAVFDSVQDGVFRVFDMHRLKRCCDSVKDQFPRELKSRIIKILEPGKEAYFEQKEPLFGAEVDGAFPSSAFDITEAGKCYALSRDTACVMHLMRALETPLQLMAADLQVVNTRDNWGKLLPLIETKVNELPNSDGVRRTDYSTAATQFRFVKNAWRDHAMHARGKYSADEAQDAYRASKAIMIALSKRLHE